MKKLFAFIYVLILVLVSCAGYAEYSYDFTTAIPKSVQSEAVEYMETIISDTSKDTRLYSYAELLDLYLKFYGIYSPISISGGLVEWVQTEIMKTPERIEYIPERYTRQGELSSWVTRYAEPGDLLLYRINGRADKCVIYAGNGKMIGRGIDNNKEMEIRATFADGEYTRTKSGGLYAIAHMWMTVPEEAEPEQCVNVQICMNNYADGFTQEHYTIYEEESNTYKKSVQFVLLEYKPGHYKVWNGDGFGVSKQYVEKNDGIHFLIVAENNNQTISKQIKISVSASELQSNNSEYTVNIPEEAENKTQWNGSDLLNMLQREAEANE